MTWKNKIQKAIKKASEDEFFNLTFDWSPAPAEEEFLKGLKSKYPYCPSAAMELLRIADGLYIYHFVIAGSSKSKFKSIAHLERDIEHFITSNELLPVANEPSGRGIFLADSNGKIHLKYCDNGDTSLIAQSYTEFIDEVLMGQKYWSLFPSKQENDWTEFLREEGWLI